MSYVQLVPTGLYQPPWTYSLKDVGMEVGYHLAYGAGVAAGFAALDQRQPRRAARKGRPASAGRLNRASPNSVKVVDTDQMRRRSHTPSPVTDDLSADWRRLRRAAVFFIACAAVFLGLLIIGLYH